MINHLCATRWRLGVFLAMAASWFGCAAAASPFGDGWSLEREASRLYFQSVKKGDIVETNKFASFVGGVDKDGDATILIQLDSIDTGIDLRNVRMRFLFFETFNFPEVMVSAKIDPETVADLKEARRVRAPIIYTLDLHGVQKELSAETIVTLISEDRVSVAPAEPIVILAKDFGLVEGVRKLEDAANVTLAPIAIVGFDFVFNRIGAAKPVVIEAEASAAVETSGAFSFEECAGRLEIVSRTGAVYFKSGSADLDEASDPILSTVVDIVQRCPSLALSVEGHTDSSGAADLNQRISEARAEAVAADLVRRGVSGDRLTTIGYGETRPVAPNDTDRNKRRNRRIQFVLADK